MNEYLTTKLGEDHRNGLLAEARANRLAREATAGRPTWWARLSTRTTAWAAGHRQTRTAPKAADHRLAA